MKKSIESQESVGGIKESSITEEELRNFIKNNQNENQTLEYKLKPNFNEIKEVMEHIKERMHFKILTTIYAFANTEGGDLYVGIGEKNISESSEEYKKGKIVVGVDECDEKTIKRILEQVTPKITKNGEKIPLKEEKRHAIKISVDELKLYEKPQLLNGVLFWRENDNTKVVKSFEDASKIYRREQFYGFLLKGIKENLYKIAKEKNSFISDQFIAGLKEHIIIFTKDNKVTDRDIVEKAIQQLGQIHEVITERRSQLFVAQAQPVYDINKLISDFISTYKAIIRLGV